jgi:hypothetical protein
LYIGDQLIDVHTGEWLHMWHQLTKRTQNERGYDILIGNVPELYTFNKNQKDPYQLIIPLKFWFCNNVGGSLPIVALKNTDVTLKVDLKNINEVSYFDTFTKFAKKPKLQCKVIAEYIFLENDERARLVQSKNEYLIEILQNNGDVEIKEDSLDETGSFITKLYFNNPVKEFIWGLQNTANIDGSKSVTNPNGELQYYNYAYDVAGKINPSDMIKIQYMSRDREQYKDAIYYDVIQPHKYHTSIPSTGINVYSLSLEPENHQQPKGAANMGRIDDSSIVTILKPDVILAMQNNGVKFRLVVYALTYQILRVMSGLAGVAFYY